MQSSKDANPIAVLIGIFLACAVFVAFYALCAAVVWNDWGLGFSESFNAKNLTAEQAALVGVMLFFARIRTPSQPEKKRKNV
jgi:hypothetical protein